jgi:hypothetical protein
VVELVDTQDLKSCGPQRPCGFNSRLGHRSKAVRNCKTITYGFFVSIPSSISCPPHFISKTLHPLCFTLPVQPSFNNIFLGYFFIQSTVFDIKKQLINLMHNQTTDMQTLTLSQFDTLCEEEKIILIDDHGVYLDVYRRSEGCKVGLFKLWGFYCEVWFHKKSNKIQKVKAFGHYKKLDPYLDQVDINSIYSLL